METLRKDSLTELLKSARHHVMVCSAHKHGNWIHLPQTVQKPLHCLRCTRDVRQVTLPVSRALRAIYFMLTLQIDRFGGAHS